MHKLQREDFPVLIEHLKLQGYQIVGPSIKDGAVTYTQITSVSDLPSGWRDEQGPGKYRLKRRADDAYFGYVISPHSWKSFLFPAREPVSNTRKENGHQFIEPVALEEPPMAFIGVRPCELAAIGMQDKVFMKSTYTETRYKHRRENAFIVAVNCLEPGELCFCDSMGTGPRAKENFDLCLTEYPDFFLVETGSEKGEKVLASLPTTPATPGLEKQVDADIEEATQQMGRDMDTENLPDLLFGNLNHDQWVKVANRCLACGNCTQVCPTCFCFTVNDVSTLSNKDSVRNRVWDSCFTYGHSYMHTGPVRGSTGKRYRQWLTHKLGAWKPQFGEIGCVGCGRCISWCPAGIDLTEEIAAIRETAKPAFKLPRPATRANSTSDILLPKTGIVKSIKQETSDVWTLRIQPPDGYTFAHGQFNMLGLPAIGESAISISGFEDGDILHTIRSVGEVTESLTSLQVGESLTIRGPFGSAWPLEEARGKEVVVVAGGIGLAPIRSALRYILDHPDDYPMVRVFFGTRNPEEILYREELESWALYYPQLDLDITVDVASTRWKGHVGVVTTLMNRQLLPKDAYYLMCGPEIMMRFAIGELKRAAVNDDRIFVSMERNMKCAAGFCGRCQYGPYFICKDGPVFSYDQIAFLFGKPGF